MAMRELNANLSQDDMKTLFTRFQTRNMDGFIDWMEFMDFWNNNIHKRAIEQGGDPDNEKSLLTIISDVVSSHLEKRKKLFRIVKTVTTDFSEESPGDANTEADSVNRQEDAASGILGELLTLDLSAVRHNAAVLAAYDIPISLQNMARLSRVFNYDVSTLLTFCEAMKAGTYENIDYILQETTAGIMKCLAGRCHAHKEFEFTSDEEIGKLWCAMAPDCDSQISFNEFSAHLRFVFCDHLESTGFESTKNDTVVDTADKAASGTTSTRGSGKPTEFLGVSIEVLCNLLSEEVFYSAWNRIHADSKKATSPSSSALIATVSYSAFKAFIKRSHVGAIEQKLQYLVHLQGCSDNGSVTYLVHIYVPTQENIAPQLRDNSKLDHLLLIAYDPLSSVTFKMKIDGDCSRLPCGERLSNIIQAKYRTAQHNASMSKVESKQTSSTNMRPSPQKRMISQEEKLDSKGELSASMKKAATKIQNRYEAYNPWETPVEDRAMMDLCNRLRLVNTGQKTVCVVSEDPKFIMKLRDLIDKASLPFFSIVNEVSLLFEVGREAANEAGSVQKLVFGSIRKYPPLRNFLVNVFSDMRVVISTYDSDVEESMEWQEMLAYLSDSRNPFVTVQLLPKYVHPERGMVRYVPDDMIQRYAKYAEDCALGKSKLEPLDEEDMVEEEGDPPIQKCLPDIDGGSHPTWDNTFRINFKPPKLNSCRVLFTDILQLSIDQCKKYIIVMVRVAEDKSLFMTAYDPRTATEYMLFGGPVGWCLPNIAHETDMSVFNETYRDDNVVNKDRLDFFQKQLEDAISRHDDPLCPPEEKFRLGFAITPRLLVCVYNQQGPAREELLGSCQVSISSVLSGTGNNATIWATLMHEIHGSSGGSSFVKAGALNMQLGYLKHAEINALREKEKKKGASPLSRVPSSHAGELLALSNTSESSTKRIEKEDGSLVSARMKVDLLYAEKLKLEKELSELQAMKTKLATDKSVPLAPKETINMESSNIVENGQSDKKSNVARTATAASSLQTADTVVGSDADTVLNDILRILLDRHKSSNAVDDILHPVMEAVTLLQRRNNRSSLDADDVLEILANVQITISADGAQV